MTLDWTLIGIGAGAFFIGYLVGLYEGRWKHKGLLKQITQERDAAREEKKKIQGALADLREKYEALQSRPAPALSLEEKQGQVQLSLDGVALSPKEITDQQHKRLLFLLNGLTPYVKRGRAAAPPKPAARPQPAANRSKPSLSARIAPKKPSAPVVPAVAEALAAAQQPKAGGSIVEQIDAILQTMLEGTPLDNRGIRLQEGPDGGVVVWVGISRYNGVDAVPDPEIKAVIQAAIKAWENRI